MESRGGDDRLVALAELSFLYPEPGAGVGSNGISPYRRDDKGLGRDIRDSVSGIDYDYDYDYDTVIPQKNGWLVFEESATRQR